MYSKNQVMCVKKKNHWIDKRVNQNQSNTKHTIFL